MKTRKEGSKARLLGLSCMALVLTAFGVTGVRADAADAKKAPPNVTSVVNVNSHFRPVELIIIFLCSIPCVLGYNVLADMHFIGSRDVLDSEDFLVSNLLLPCGALVYLLFCVTKWGWGFDKYTAECNTGSGPKMPQWVKPYFKYVLPVLIAVILVQGLL